MSYATLDDLLQLADRQRLIELTDRADPPAGDIDSARVDWALGQAEALIDARLSERYALPLSPAPAILTRVAAVIAYHDLHIEAVPEKVAADYGRQLAWLDAVAAGHIALPGIDGAGDSAAGPARSHGPARTFTRSSLKGY